MAERTITSFDGTPIWYSDTGAAGPAVVLLHDVSMTSITNFDIHYGPGADGRIGASPGPTIASALRDSGARVVAIDARGHGRSGRSPDPVRYRGDTHLRDVTAVLDDLGVDKLDLVGYSMGSYTAARMLSSETRLRAVALCATNRGFLDDADLRSLRALDDWGGASKQTPGTSTPSSSRFAPTDASTRSTTSTPSAPP